MRYLADRIGTTPRTLQNHLALLGQIGVVRVDSRPGQSSIYTVSREVMEFVRSSSGATYEKFSGTYENSSPRNLKKVKNQDSPLPPTSNIPPHVHGSGGGGAFSAAPSRSQEQIAAFQRVWAIYPVKQGHDVALRLFLSLGRARRLPDLDVLLAAITAHTKQDSRWQRGKIPLLHRWLREGRWADLPFVEPNRSQCTVLAAAVEDEPRLVLLQRRLAALSVPAPVTGDSVVDSKFEELWEAWGLKQARSAALSFWNGLSEAVKESTFSEAKLFVQSQPRSWPLLPTWLRQHA